LSETLANKMRARRTRKIAYFKFTFANKSEVSKVVTMQQLKSKPACITWICSWVGIKRSWSFITDASIARDFSDWKQFL